MVAVGGFAKNLGKLVDAVRRHDARILIEKVGQPTEQTDEKRTQGGVIPVEVYKSRQADREPAAAAGVCIGSILPVSPQDFVQIHFVAGIGEQKL